MTTQSPSSQWIAVILATSLHIAIGWALFLASQSGVPLPSTANAATGNTIIVKLLPFDAAGATQPIRSQLPSSETNAGPTLQPARPTAGQLRDDRSLDTAAPAVAQGPSTDSAAIPTPINARSMADLPDSEVLAYRARLQAHLARFRLYPVGARDAGEQGVVFLHFLMDRDGRVVNAWLETTSGVAEIDREAIAAVIRAQPLPSLPAGWPAQLDISLPVSFKLD